MRRAHTCGPMSAVTLAGYLRSIRLAASVSDLAAVTSDINRKFARDETAARLVAVIEIKRHRMLLAMARAAAVGAGAVYLR